LVSKALCKAHNARATSDRGACCFSDAHQVSHGGTGARRPHGSRARREKRREEKRREEKRREEKRREEKRREEKRRA
jgi:hypothetical protein